MKDLYFLNGEIVNSTEATLHVSDLALLRGYGIFDFFRAIDGQPVFLEDHLDRLENSARLMELTLPFSREAIRNGILEIIRLNPNSLLGVKVLVTGGYSPDGYTPAEPNVVIFGKPFQFAHAPNGLKLMTVDYCREIPEIKTINYVVAIRTLKKQKEIGADDVLFHQNGLISESSRSNIFIVKNEKSSRPKPVFYTELPANMPLPVPPNSLKLKCGTLVFRNFFDADEVFMTASTKRITPVTRVDDRVFGNGKPGKITLRMMEMFLEHERNAEKVEV